MTALKRRIVDLPDGRHWALYGQRGVVDWVLLKGGDSLDCHGEVGMHAPTPRSDMAEPDEGCLVLEGACYVEWNDSGGVHIGGEWEEAGFDDEVIWRWLTEYYSELPAGGQS